MTSLSFHRGWIGFASALALAGCANFSADHSSSTDNAPLPQPSGELPPAPPATAPEQAPTPPVPSVPDSSADNTISIPDSTDIGGPGFDNVEIVDDSLKEKLAIRRVGSDHADSNLLTVFAGVKNLTSHALPIEIQTIYKDKSGNPMSDGKASWIPIKLRPHEQFDYRSVALSLEAVDFLVRIRRAQPEPAP